MSWMTHSTHISLRSGMTSAEISESTNPPSSVRMRASRPRKPLRADSSASASLRKEAGSQSLIRSEEHTSELQSLMRISYAVFCLKKKKKTYVNHELQLTKRQLP